LPRWQDGLGGLIIEAGERTDYRLRIFLRKPMSAFPSQNWPVWVDLDGLDLSGERRDEPRADLIVSPDADSMKDPGERAL
jgi:hypothetical protein